MTHTLPALPYDITALEPHISQKTLKYHYGKHHKTYVDKLNPLLEGTEFAESSLEEIIIKAPAGPIFNNAAQIWNHTFYWNCLSPNGGGAPSGKIGAKIVETFGSFESFQKEFTKKALTLFGSGWVWLVIDSDQSLSIEQTSNADNPLRKNQTPILTCDVWEHAYYIDYYNSRPDYMKAFWNLVHWEFVEKKVFEVQ